MMFLLRKMETLDALTGGVLRLSGPAPVPVDPLLFQLWKEVRLRADGAAPDGLPENAAAPQGDPALLPFVLLFENTHPEQLPDAVKTAPHLGFSLEGARFVPFDLAPVYDGGRVYCVEETLLTAMEARLSRRYNIITLDAAKLRDKLPGESGTRAGITLDFRTRHTGPDGTVFTAPSVEKRLYTQTVDRQADSALFYQIRRLLPHLGREALCADDGDLLRHTLFFVDFQETVRSGELDRFRPVLTHGIRIRFDGMAEPVTFVPFEKSASMSRTSVISFVDQRIYAALEARLMNGMQIEKTNLSKLYAYKGLYLSAARRLPMDFTRFHENSVIVLEDDIHPEYVDKDALLTAVRRVPISAGAWLRCLRHLRRFRTFLAQTPEPVRALAPVLGAFSLAVPDSAPAEALERAFGDMLAEATDFDGLIRRCKRQSAETPDSVLFEFSRVFNGRVDAEKTLRRVAGNRAFLETLGLASLEQVKADPEYYINACGPDQQAALDTAYASWEILEDGSAHRSYISQGPHRGSIKIEDFNEFDGQGLVTGEMAAQLQSLPGLEQASSFQIRMPFVKGMLHQVDFPRFLRDELGYTPLEACYFTDIYGIRRPADQVCIILTRSMFKCHKWLRQFFGHLPPETREAYGGDPMRFYFAEMRKYGHTLYAGNTDKNLSSHGEVALNYQFISTLDLTTPELKGLIRRANAAIDRSEGLLRRTSRAQGAEETGNSDTLEFSGTPEDASPVWLQALRRHEGFRRDEKVAWEIRQYRHEQARDLCFGRLPVRGDNKLLAKDLLAFLLHIAGLVRSEAGRRPDWLRRYCISRGEFFLPGPGGPGSGQVCGLLRNPHLSRNEQVALRRYVPDPDSGSERDRLYQSYFSHLTGVVMLPYRSLAAMALGGADFDGDLVKVIYEPDVNRAILRGVYGGETPSGPLKRTLPIIQIPAVGAEEKHVRPGLDFETIQNTFSNSIGLISYDAVRIGSAEYKTARDDPWLKNQCALCTILTGLEIDAAKTGAHPNTTIMLRVPWEDLLRRLRDALAQAPDAENTGRWIDMLSQQDVKSSPSMVTLSLMDYLSLTVGRGQFIDFMNEVKKLPAASRYYVKFDAASGTYGLYRRLWNRRDPESRRHSEVPVSANTFARVMSPQAESDMPNVEFLSLAFLQKDYQLAQTESAADPESGPRGKLVEGISVRDADRTFRLFRYQAGDAPADENDQRALIQRHLGDAKRKKLAAVMTAYNDVMDLPRYVRHFRQDIDFSRALPYAYTVTGLQYDGWLAPMGPGGVLVEEAMARAQAAIARRLGFDPLSSLDDETALDLLARATALRDHLAPESDTQDGLLWPFLSRSARLAYLDRQIFKDVALDPAVSDLLTQFNCGGYNLLYFLLDDAVNQIRSSILPALLEQKIQRELTQTLYRTNKRGETVRRSIRTYDTVLYESLYRALAQIYREAVDKGESRAIWHEKILACCRAQLLALFPKGESALAVNVYLLRASDPSRRFFWSGVLEDQAILSALGPREPEEGGAPHA